MTPAQLRAALSGISEFMENEGHGVLLSLKNGTEISGDYYSIDNKEANPIDGMFRVDRYVRPTFPAKDDRFPISFVEIESIASVTAINLGVSTDD